MSKPTSVFVSVLVGVLLAGPLAALALVAVPEQWRGPAVPVTVVAVTIALVVFVRQPRRPSD
ncbi:MAG: hypothetical protein NTV05_07795 [Acidobacteria bacterium]|nr:hypothetical protein [Acidobacteriota bacterium]